MTPEERKLVTELFDRLTTLEDAARDPEAEGLVKDGLRQAANAPYTLVQTVLVQDEALKRANARIRELEDELGGAPEPAPAQPGFLDNVRGALFGTPEPPRGTTRPGSVPSVRPRQTGTAPPPPTYPAAAQPMAEPYGQGGSFLGTAAATAAGVIGSSLLLGGIRSMMGGGHSGAHAAGFDPSVGSQRDLTTPWSNTQTGDLAREAGIDHIGHSPPQDNAGGGDAHGFFDNSADNADHIDDDNVDDDADFGDDDFGGGDDGGGDNGSGD